MAKTATVQVEKKVAKPRKAKAAEPATEIVAYKGFDKDLKCLGYQYEIGKTYEHPGRVELCSTGFHSCTDPLDVLTYYDVTSSRFATVKAGGTINTRKDGDSKIASASISIVAELKLPDFIRAAVKATIDLCKASKTTGGSLTSGDSAKNASSGDYATNASSGEKSVIAAAGLYSQAKGAIGTAIAMPYKDDAGQIRFACGVVGEDNIPADTWLIAKGGKLVSA